MTITREWVKNLRAKGIKLGMQFRITHRCNLRCTHCYPYFIGKQKDLSARLLKEKMDSLAKDKCLFLNVTGGEPLVRKDFLPLMQYARDKSFALILETNGTLITAKIADAIARLNFWEVDVNVLSADPRAHDSITKVKGSHRKAVNAVKMLTRRSVRTRMQTCLMRKDTAEEKDIKNLARQLGVDVDIYMRHE